jgi:hypothetical protein
MFSLTTEEAQELVGILGTFNGFVVVFNVLLIESNMEGRDRKLNSIRPCESFCSEKILFQISINA